MEEEGAVTWPRKLRAHWRLPSLPNNIHSPNNNPRRRARTFIGLFASSIRYIVRLLTGNLFKRLNKSKTKVKKRNGSLVRCCTTRARIYLSICLSIYRSICPSVYLSLYPSSKSVWLQFNRGHNYARVCRYVHRNRHANTHALSLNHTNTHTRIHARAHTHLQKQVIMTPCSLFWRELVSCSALRI